MRTIKKKVAKDSCNWAINGGKGSNETNLKISPDIARLFGVNPDTFSGTTDVEFYIYKEDFVKSLCRIFSKMPLAKTKTGKVFGFSQTLFFEDLTLIQDFFGQNAKTKKSAKLGKPTGHNFCLNFGSSDTFPIREFLLEKHSVLEFSKDGSDVVLHVTFSETVVESDESVDENDKKKTQIIFYGAPGTGKSHGVKAITGEHGDTELDNVFRTTFHPDTDYASFVGCYKPTKKEEIPTVLSLDALKEKIQNLKSAGQTFPEHKISARYWESIEKYTKTEIVSILDNASMYAEVGKGKAIGQFLAADKTAPITYEFVPQTFTNAYVYAYNHPKEDTYLVIEEINRGNCAQIFGDLFQLLDRKQDGVSEYSVIADTDLRKYLEQKLIDKKGIKNGKLILPSNLHILATMNTSDQSLFPIDSAFKRRWDWKYVPIEQPEVGEDGEPRKWKLVADNHWCYWWEFLSAINEQIEEATNSEDKQLGYFFTKPTAGDTIDADTFVSKVLFYLWNDVFKDEDSDIFKYRKLEGNWEVKGLEPKKNDLYFRSFVLGSNEVNEKLIHWFINNLLLSQSIVMLDDVRQDPVKTNEIAFMRPCVDVVDATPAPAAETTTETEPTTEGSGE